MSKEHIKCIYVDMDGVIADFRKRYIELYHADPMDSHKHKKMRANWNKFVESGEFANLDLMPDAKIGINYLNGLDIPIKILSSTANQKQYDNISKDKLSWLKQHKIKWEPHFVPGKKFKKDYAKKGYVLIDDTKITIEEWDDEGGIGIYHTDWITTISILKTHLTK